MARESIKEKYSVKSIDSALCKEWLLYKHYAKRIPSIQFSFGLFHKNILQGVLTFGQPPSPSLKISICGEKYQNDCIELNRLIVNDGLGKNTLSYFVSCCLKLLPKPKIVVSFADPNNGHQGYIYQSTNWIYTGLTSNTECLIDENGKEIHFRTIGHKRNKNIYDCELIKYRTNENEIDKIEIANFLKSNKSNYKNKELDFIFGYKDTAAHWFRTDKGFSLPSVDDWFKLKEILKFDDSFDQSMNQYKLVPNRKEQLEKMKLNILKIEKKHRYVYFVGTKTKIKEYKLNFKLVKVPYPKGENKRYDASYQPTIQTQLF